MTRPLFALPPQEREARAAAIDPLASVFLSANAGSGKTTILTSRVIRLLLEGVAPARILCLTYTKAAAAEMQNRVFDTLAGWVRLDDVALGEKVAALTGGPAPAARLALARQLFARAVETPGGLKIQTIHAFAERLLHLFPIEANVPFRFTAVDDLAQAEMLRAARRATIRAALAAPEGALGRAFGHLAALVAEDGLETLLAEALPALRRLDCLDDLPAARRAHLARALGLPPGADERHLERLVTRVFDAASWAERAGAMAAHPKAAKTDRETAEALRQAAEAKTARQALTTLGEGLITDKGTVRARLVTKEVAAADPGLAEALADLGAQVLEARDTLNALDALEASDALVTFGADVLARVTAAKRARALVDFDDMIALTERLVSDPGAAWVLEKLDGGIDHVLVDEAQDTTPQMWRILRDLTAEFFAGAGARTARRTVFAVGDEKQSIYSFQGARPEAFAGERAHYEGQVTGAGRLFNDRKLQLSFRTVGDVLDAVDRVFSAPERYRGLSAEPEPTVHTSARLGAAGFVECWPPVEQVRAVARDPWEEVDSPGRQSAQVLLARRIARHVAHLIAHDRFDDDGAPVRPGDIMILLQRRDPFFEAVIRALKQAGLPVAGADRMRLTEEQAVRDLIAAARTALLPEDDLTLAESLKSPLIGLTDDDLLRLAPGRTGSLYAALGASPDPHHRAARATIEQWISLAGRTTPHGFFSTLLSPMGGRRALLARLGPDAADGLAMFLASVRSREGRFPPSLQAEVEAFASLTGSLKRDQDHAGNTIRVMTVHGAKGLEARVVYLPDATRLPNIAKESPLIRQPLRGGPEALLLWGPGGRKARPGALEALHAERRALGMEEYRRLAYVAMTRARDRLYVAGWGDPAKINPESWYGMVTAGLDGAMVSGPDILGEGEVLRFRSTPQSAPVPGLERAGRRSSAALPEWIGRAAPDERLPAPPLAPSRAAAPSAGPLSPERDAAREAGLIAHRLIERLPEVPAAGRAALAQRMLAAHAPAMTAEARADLTARLLALLDDARAAPLFGPGSQPEVAIAGTVRLAGGRSHAALGRIDRLAVLEDRVLVADFKTGRRPPEGPRATHLAQLALYRALLAGLYPDRPVEALLVWLREGRLEPVAPEGLDRALAEITAERT